MADARGSLRVCGATGAAWSAGTGGGRVVARHGDLVAVAGDQPFPWWPGRAHYDGHVLRHRVVVHDGTGALRHVLDDLRYTVHEIAWRPDGGALALATGEYDGGWRYEGELVVWELASNRTRRPMREERFVTRVRWADAHRVVVLARPPTDEDGDPGDRYVGTFGEVGSLEARPGDPRAAGFDGPDATFELPPDATRTAERIWDLAFTHRGERLVACGETGVERFTAALEPLGRELEGVRCVQVLTHGDEVWVHALAGSRHAPVSELYRLGAEGARRVRTFDRVHLLSIDAGGRMLARDTTLDAEHRTDRVLHPDGTDALVRDLGRFDAFNHSVRVDHRSELWFLRGTPPASHQAKTLCVVEADGTVRTALAWDEGTSHRMEACATATGDGALVTGYRLHHPHPGKGERWIACRPLDGGPATWRVRWPWAPVALATVPTLGLVLVATLDGRLAALDRATGECLASEVLAAGTRVSPLCLAVAGTRAAVGTLDGRILRLDLGGTQHAVRRPPPDGLHPHSRPARLT